MSKPANCIDPILLIVFSARCYASFREPQDLYIQTIRFPAWEKHLTPVTALWLGWLPGGLALPITSAAYSVTKLESQECAFAQRPDSLREIVPIFCFVAISIRRIRGLQLSSLLFKVLVFDNFAKVPSKPE